jgi:uncharacterized protein (TIGR03000 family)
MEKILCWEDIAVRHGWDPFVAVLIAQLPEEAVLWVEGRRTTSAGWMRYFRSPPLRPGRKYSYLVRVAWIEDGCWVSQTRKLPVRAGRIQAVYLRPRSDSRK